jgi:DNA-binding PadR family transcriptional regulator
MQLELDSTDIHLLKEMAVLGEVGPKTLDKVLDDDRRLEQLEVEGYVSSFRRDPPGLDAPPAWVYRLTIKGRAIAAGK